MFKKTFDKDKTWKKKAKDKSLEIKNLKKDVRDLKASRDNWKTKAAIFHEKIKYLEDELKKN